MNILITGATGFIGRKLVDRLARTNHKVTIVVRDFEKAKSLFKDIDLEYLHVDDLKKETAKTYDIAIHLAAFLSSRDDSESVDKLLQSNILFGVDFLRYLQKCNIKYLINFGTFAEFSNGPAEIANAYFYSATKTAFREIAKYYARRDGYKMLDLIPYTVYGDEPGQGKVLDLLRSSMQSAEPIALSPGNQRLDFIHVDDVVSFLLHCIDRIDEGREFPQSLYHLGSGKGYTLREIAGLIEKKYGHPCNIAWGKLPYRPLDVMHAVAPQQPLLTLGWTPQIKLEDKV